MRTLIVFFFIAVTATNMCSAQWTQTDGPYGGTVMCLAVSPNGTGGTKLFAGCSHDDAIYPQLTGGVFLSTNNGTNWAAVNGGLTNTDVRSLVVTGTNVFVGTYGGGVFRSTNNGTSWSAVNSGLTDWPIWSLTVSGRDLIAGTNGGVWKRPLSEMITSIESCELAPACYMLAQNYPNPFNPSTTITYELPKSSEVRLSIYDVIGREVSLLVNERRDAGTHEVAFDGSKLASGVYLYRLQAGDFLQTKRSLLLR